MRRVLKTVIVNGSLGRPSRTRVLLDTLQQRLQDAIALDVQTIDLVDLVADIGSALSKDALSAPGQAALTSIERADLLVVGSPVFRGSLPGLLKHLFDLIEMDALHGKPVLLAATGGSQRHALIIEHQLRPLFGFFQALTLPIGVYATPEDFKDGHITSHALQDRIDLTVQFALPTLQALLQRTAASTPRKQEATFTPVLQAHAA